MPRASAARGERGFTLIEVLVVLAILGMIGGLVLSRGPQRSGAVTMNQATATVAGALRLARGRAIAANAPVGVAFSPPGGTLQVAGEPVRALPRGIALGVTVAARSGADDGVPRIVFLPDGSSTGGRVDLAGAGRTAEVGVDWLTGRVRVAQ